MTAKSCLIYVVFLVVSVKVHSFLRNGDKNKVYKQSLLSVRPYCKKTKSDASQHDEYRIKTVKDMTD